MNAPHPPHERIDSDHYEPSPSTGHVDVTRILDATAGADHTPECDTVDCSRDGEPVTVVDAATGGARRTARCREHTKPALEVTS